MSVAVKNFVGLSEKEPTDSLLKLSIYYDFRFCNAYAGNEKGHVAENEFFAIKFNKSGKII